MRIFIQLLSFALASMCLYIIGQSGLTVEACGLLIGYSFVDWGE